MKILFVAKPQESIYTDELAEYLSVNNDLTYSLDNFWERKGNFDIIHFHWPEILTKWRVPTEYEYLFIKDVLLPYWKKKSKIVITRHNMFPHYRKNQIFIKLYELLFSFADGVIHMGEYCYNDFSKRYFNLKNYKYLKRTIIPHHVFVSYPNNISKTDSRKKLGLKQKKYIILFAGNFRDKEEADLLYNAFNKVKIKNKLLICLRWWDFNNEPPKKEIKRWLKWRFRTLKIKISSKYYFKNIFVKNNELQFYVNSADLLVIPRKSLLNSAIIPLAFAFKKLVVAPETGNLTEVMKATNNPIFKPDNIDSFIFAIKKGEKLSKTNLGKKNFSYAQKYMNINYAIKKHLEFYNVLINEK